VLELEWCARYLWLSKRLGVPVTPSMAAGKAEEEASRRKLASIFGVEPRRAYIDVGWAHGVVDLLVKRFSAMPVELKSGIPRREHKWQLYAEAYLVKASGNAVREGILFYSPNSLKRIPLSRDELNVGERLLMKAAEVVEGPPPPPTRTGKCSYCQYRNVCTYT